MQLEPLLDATDAPCPRCAAPLEVAEGDARTHECPRCGGIFVSREALAEILCRAEIGGALAPPPPRAPSMLDEVRYVPCPLCHASMNRANFGKVSGVIVDVCAKHGTWFDAGELTRVVAFAASGGLERTRAREAEEKKDADRRSAAPSLELAAANVRLDARQRLSVWEDFLAIMLRW